LAIEHFIAKGVTGSSMLTPEGTSRSWRSPRAREVDAVLELLWSVLEGLPFAGLLFRIEGSRKEEEVVNS
jgi:hypothetical protein